MMLRDRELGTNVHREGGWGNEIAAQLFMPEGHSSAQEIVEFVARACGLYDEISAELYPDYNPRIEKVSAAINRARKSAGRGLPSPGNRE
jgi:hypothetical protein